MENNFFYKKYQRKSDSELQRILKDPNYTEEALLAATQILKERNHSLTEEQQSRIEKIEAQKEERKVTEEEQGKESELSPFTKRIISVVIDFAILSGISYLIGFTFVGYSLIKAPWELVISLLLILGYFSTLNSTLGGGSPGKRLMNISVANYQFQRITFLESLARYSILIIPYFLLNYLDYLSINSFGIVYGLTYSYYIGILYFPLSDKELRRGFHDLLTKSIVVREPQKDLNLAYPKRKSITYYIISIVVTLVFVGIHFYTINSGNQTTGNKTQVAQLEATLNENLSTFKTIIADVQAINGVSEVEGIGLNTTDGVTSLDITIRPSSFFKSDELCDRVYESLKGKELKVNRLDYVKIIRYYGFRMTLASYNKTETKTYKQ